MALSFDDFKVRYPEFATTPEWQYNEAVMLAECKFANGCCGSDESKYNTILGYLTAHLLWFMQAGNGSSSTVRDTTSESLGGASVSFAQLQGKYNVPFGGSFYNTSKYGQMFAQMAQLCGYLGRII